MVDGLSPLESQLIGDLISRFDKLEEAIRVLGENVREQSIALGAHRVQLERLAKIEDNVHKLIIQAERHQAAFTVLKWLVIAAWTVLSALATWPLIHDK